MALHPEYIVGLTDGEGCFCYHTAPLNYNNRPSRPVFLVSNTYEEVLRMMQDTLKIGHIYGKRPRYPNAKICYYLSIAKLSDLLKIVEFFDKYPLIIKREEFLLWREEVLKLKQRQRTQPKMVGKEEEFQIIQAYLNGTTWRQLSIKFNRGEGTVQRILKQNNILYRGRESTQFKKGNYPARWKNRL